MQKPAEKIKNWNETVHYALNGAPACSPVATHKSWLAPSVATVTCERCIAKFGPDTPGLTDEPQIDANVARRAAERAARRAARGAK